jgi:hypothetical protein
MSEMPRQNTLELQIYNFLNMRDRKINMSFLGVGTNERVRA